VAEGGTVTLPEEWQSVAEGAAANLTAELARELPPGHPLCGVPVAAIAYRNPDDVLFRLLDGSGRLAVVQLTWSRGLESLPRPFTKIYADEADLRPSVDAEDREQADASPCAVEGGHSPGGPPCDSASDVGAASGGEMGASLRGALEGTGDPRATGPAPADGPRSTTPERPESRWLCWLTGEYAGDPETLSLIVHERWQAAGADLAKRADVVAWSMGWLLSELEHTVRLGRDYLDALPEGGVMVAGYWDDPDGPEAKLYAFYGHRVGECLRRALEASERCLEDGVLEMESLSMAVRLARHRYSDLLSLNPGALDRTEGAVRVLGSAIEAESRLVRPEDWAGELRRELGPTTTEGQVPSWDGENHELSFGGRVCGIWRNNNNKQSKILIKFQESGWPKSISTLRLLSNKKEIHNVVYQINRKIKETLKCSPPIRFGVEGTAKVIWSPAPSGTDVATDSTN
jgi:hypothetical protein